MKKSIFFLLHLAYGFAVIIFSLFLMGALDEISTEEQPLSYYFHTVLGFVTLPAFITFNGSYWWLFPRFVQQRKKWQLVIFGILLVMLAGIIGALYLILSLENQAVVVGNFSTLLINLLLISGLSTISAVVGLVLKGFVTWFQESKDKTELLEQNHQIEIALIKSQLDPHFLFNTLNNIDVLILKNPQVASEYLNRLSDIMRFMLFETKTEQIPLQQELIYIEKYITLQKIRTANEQYVHYQVQGHPEQRMIAPMTFIPFIENAFKHNNNKKIKNAISINLEISPQSILFSCTNQYDLSTTIKENHHGLGNELMKKRLELLYPASHQLEVQDDGSFYQILLTIQTP